jgi:hypothetical protein
MQPGVATREYSHLSAGIFAIRANRWADRRIFYRLCYGFDGELRFVPLEFDVATAIRLPPAPAPKRTSDGIRASLSAVRRGDGHDR